MTATEPGDRAHVLDAVARARAVDHSGVCWSVSSDQLHLNLVRLAPDQAVAEHINDEVDLAGTVVSGELTLRLPEGEQQLPAGGVFFVPRGLRRGFQAGPAGCAYVTCHPRRRGLWPERTSPPSR